MLTKDTNLSITRFSLAKVMSQPASKRILILPKSPGKSFLINYQTLKYRYRDLNPAWIREYLILASYRDYESACRNKDLTIPWEYADDIAGNELLYTRNARIHFLYEEWRKEEWLLHLIKLKEKQNQTKTTTSGLTE